MTRIALIGPLVDTIPNDYDYYIGVDYGSHLLLLNGFTNFTAIGDFDSIGDEEFLELKNHNINIIKLNPVKDNSDLDAALEYAALNKYQNIDLYGFIGQRLDHTLINIALLYKYHYLTINMYDNFNKVSLLKAGVHELEVNDYQYFSFFSKEDTIISLIDFKYPLTDYVLKVNDSLCLSNELKEKGIVKCNKDIILVQSV